jgi:hypothetical protein
MAQFRLRAVGAVRLGFGRVRWIGKLKAVAVAKVAHTKVQFRGPRVMMVVEAVDATTDSTLARIVLPICEARFPFASLARLTTKPGTLVAGLVGQVAGRDLPA